MQLQSTLGSQLEELESAIASLIADSTSAKLVHNLRVTTRKIDAVLYLCKELVPRKSYRFYRKHCAQLRALADPIRDYDVLEKRACSGNQPGTEIEKVKAIRKSAEHGLRRALDGSLSAVEFLKHRQRIMERSIERSGWHLGTRLMRLHGKYLRLATRAVIRTDHFHKWRICGKSLRYALEFCQRLGCPGLFNGCDTLQQLQSELGEYTDRKFSDKFYHRSDAKAYKARIVDGQPNRIVQLAEVTLAAVQACHWCVDNDSRQP